MTRTVRDGAEFAGALDASVPVMASLAGRLVSAADRDDLVQDALLVAWRRRDTYDGSRGTLQNWLLVIVIDQARKRRRRRSPDLWDTVPEISHTDRVADIDLERAIAALPERQRLAVTLHYFCDLPVVDVAAAMRCAEGTAKSALARARRTLTTTLGETL